MEREDLLDLIERGRESRRVEMKRSIDFAENRIKAKIAKAAMGMANTRDGGLIILGMEEIDDEHFEPEGVAPAHLASIGQDRVSSVVAVYASPYVELTVTRLTSDRRPPLRDKTYVVIDVAEFPEAPVICKRSYQPERLREGAIYIRSFERHETREVRSEAEMRELLDIATEKRLRKHLQMTERAGGGIVPATAGPADQERFRAQLKDLRP